MKKQIATLLCMVMILSLVACKNTSAPAGTDAGVNTENGSIVSADDNGAEDGNTSEEAEGFYNAGYATFYGLEGATLDFNAAYDNFTKAAELGKTDANFYLGALSDVYGYPTRDYSVAKQYYEKCEDNPYAQTALAVLYAKGNGVEEDQDKAKELVDAVIAKGVPEGYYGAAVLIDKKLGNAFWPEDGVEYDKAIENCNKVLEEGTEPLFISNAMVALGDYYHNGGVVEQDAAKAAKLYGEAIDLGNPTAMSRMAELYAFGDGVEQDNSKQLELLEKAVDIGTAEAMFNLGSYYYAVEKNAAKAEEWFEKSVALGDGEWAYLAGITYEFGLGNRETDIVKAIEWYERAGDMGNIDSMMVLGRFYKYGEYASGYSDTYKDSEKSRSWYEKAANLGNAEAMYEVGDYYYFSLKDYEKAKEWYEKALEAGYEYAQMMIDIIDNP